MAVRIRLTRVGATKRPAYRVVAIDRRSARDGRALAILGFYDPLTDPATVNLDAEQIRTWMARGALPSDTVVRLMRQAGMTEAGSAPTTPARAAPRARKPRPAAVSNEAPAAPSATPSAAPSPASEPSIPEEQAEA